jgi:uncharacterized membrane protein
MTKILTIFLIIIIFILIIIGYKKINQNISDLIDLELWLTL